MYAKAKEQFSYQQSNDTLREACLTHNAEYITSIVNDLRATIDIDSFLNWWINSDHNVSYDVDGYIQTIDESAIFFVIEAIKPTIDIVETEAVFRNICYASSNHPNLLLALMETYADKLTPGIIGLITSIAAVSHDLRQRQLKFSEIIDAHSGMINEMSYWDAVSICCCDQRPDLVQRLTGAYGFYPRTYSELEACFHFCCVNNDVQSVRVLLDKYGGVVCRPLLNRCTYTNNTEILEIVFTEYIDALSARTIKESFEEACLMSKPDLVQLYVSQFSYIQLPN